MPDFRDAFPHREEVIEEWSQEDGVPRHTVLEKWMDEICASDPEHLGQALDELQENKMVHLETREPATGSCSAELFYDIERA